MIPVEKSVKPGRAFSGNMTKREEKFRNYKAPLVRKAFMFSPKN